MLNFITNNLSNIVVATIVVTTLIAAILKIISDKKKGKCSCSGGCANCPNSKSCNTL